jgi:hypothetical protein
MPLEAVALLLTAQQSVALWHANTLKLCRLPKVLSAWHQYCLLPMQQAECHTPQIYCYENPKIVTCIIHLNSLLIKLGSYNLWNWSLSSFSACSYSADLSNGKLYFHWPSCTTFVTIVGYQRLKKVRKVQLKLHHPSNWNHVYKFALTNCNISVRKSFLNE